MVLRASSSAPIFWQQDAGLLKFCLNHGLNTGLPGWIKTETLVSSSGKGAGFRMDGLDVEPIGFTGTNDWTLVSYEFETGNNDCVTISCVFDTEKSAKGRAWFDNMNLELISSEKVATRYKKLILLSGLNRCLFIFMDSL